MKRTVLAVLFIAALAPGAFARVRAVHRPAPHSCTFSLSPTWNGSIGAGGVTRATVLVFGQTGACATWAAYSSASWAVVEAAPMDAQPAAYVTVAANTGPTSRTVSLIIAGVRLQVTQEGGATISPPTVSNLVANGTFDRDVTGWAWWRADYPNGPGAPQWSQFDAAGNPTSGSMLLRDTDSDYNQSFQRAQCFPIPPGRSYAFGAKVRVGSPSGDGLIAFLTYASSDCSGNYSVRNVQVARPAQPGAWQAYDFTQPIPNSARSAILLLGSAADVPPFEVWFDDAYVREVK